MLPENANAHDSGDCLSTCPHPDHAYDEDWTEEEIRLALGHRLREAFTLALDDLAPELMGPVTL